MRLVSLPRYLQVAHWLHEQQRWISTQEVSNIFSVSVKAVADDIGKLRRRPDIVELSVHKEGVCTLIKVVHIYPYQLDAHREPCCLSIKLSAPALIWRTLLSRPWHQVVLAVPKEHAACTTGGAEPHME